MSAEALNFDRTHQPEMLFTHEVPTSEIEPFDGKFKKLGMVLVNGGYNFSVPVDSSVVHAVDVCIHDETDPFKIVKRWRINETNREIEPKISDYDTTHTIGGFIPEYDLNTGVTMGAGTRYSLRVVDSDWTRNDGVKTEDIPLIDPRAKRVLLLGRNDFSPTMHGVSEYPLSVITSDEPYVWKHAKPEFLPTDLNICEMHIVTATLGMTVAPEREHLRGTYAGAAIPEAIAYLNEQSYNAVSILPVQLAISEPHLQKVGRKNHFNYVTASYFALNEAYAASDDPILEFREMVDTFHGAGKKVFLDVVYNHTAEGGPDDPTFSQEALNRKNTYKLDGNCRGNLIDDSLCGNTLDMTKPAVVREIIESLRYFVMEMGVDGFRFDLAGILAQGHDDFDQAPLMKAIAEDPILSQVVLIAEPWGATGYYKLDEYRYTKSADWMAWNDQYRKRLRGAIFEGDFDKQDLSNKLTGHNTPSRTINYVTAHDGNTLRDLAGDSAAAERFALAALAFSQGIPQRQAGSEFGYSQGGNPDAYDCPNGLPAPYQLPWEKLLEPNSREAQLYEFSAAVNRLRAEHSTFRQANQLAGMILDFEMSDGKRAAHPLGEKDVAWLGAFGVELTKENWEDGDKFFIEHLSGLPSGDDANFILLINGKDEVVTATLGSDENPSAFGIFEEVVNTKTGFATSDLGVGKRITEERVEVAPNTLILLRQILQRLPGVKGKLE